MRAPLGGNQLSWPHARVRHCGIHYSFIVFSHVFVTFFLVLTDGSCGSQEEETFPEHILDFTAKCSLSFFLWLPPILGSGTQTDHVMSYGTLSKLSISADPQFPYMLMFRSEFCPCIHQRQMWKHYEASQATHAGVLLSLRGSQLSLPRTPAVPGLKLKMTALRRVYRLLPSHIPYGNS